MLSTPRKQLNMRTQALPTRGQLVGKVKTQNKTTCGLGSQVAQRGESLSWGRGKEPGRLGGASNTGSMSAIIRRNSFDGQGSMRRERQADKITKSHNTHYGSMTIGYESVMHLLKVYYLYTIMKFTSLSSQSGKLTFTFTFPTGLCKCIIS